MKLIGKIPADYPPFIKSEVFAEYVGVILGDGNISKFPRTERLTIVGNANNPGFIQRYAELTSRFFSKQPAISKMSGANAIRISIYQKNISTRLKIPTGNRSKFEFRLPGWIWRNKIFLIKFLKGLFEAEGSLSIHMPTYTYNFQFKNYNKSLLKVVSDSLMRLGYNPEIRENAIRLRKKEEVVSFKNLIKFREYIAE